MSRNPFVVLVSDLVGHPGQRRDVTITGDFDIDMPQARTTEQPGILEARIDATTDGVVVTGTARAEVVLVCNRCLAEVPAEQTAQFTQVYGFVESDDIEPISTSGEIDLGAVTRDEFSLSLPLVPVCRPDCLGLCPTCGTDLNRAPCSGHADEPDSPFAALRDLIQPEPVDPPA